MLATESWKRRNIIKLREAASGEKLLLHRPILLASSSSLPAAWQGKCRRRLLVENLFRGTGCMGADEERYFHFPGSSHCAEFGAEWQCVLAPGHSPARQGKAVSWVTLARVQQQVLCVLMSSERLPQHRRFSNHLAQAPRRTWPSVSISKHGLWLAKKGGNRAKSINLWAVGWITLCRCIYFFFFHPPYRRGRHHDPPQPQDGRWSSSACLNCFFSPWPLREYCD